MVKIDELFAIDNDNDGTFQIIAKPAFYKHRIYIRTIYGVIDIASWFKNELDVEISSFAVVDDHPVLNEISLLSFERRPPEGVGKAYIKLTKVKAKKKVK